MLLAGRECAPCGCVEQATGVITGRSPSELDEGCTLFSGVRKKRGRETGESASAQWQRRMIHHACRTTIPRTALLDHHGHLSGFRLVFEFQLAPPPRSILATSGDS